MKNSKKLSKLVALAVLLGSVSYGGNVWAANVDLKGNVAYGTPAVYDNYVVTVDSSSSAVVTWDKVSKTITASSLGGDSFSNIYGGYNGTDTTDVSNNVVIIRGGSFETVVGGWMNDASGSAKTNRVVIQGGHYSGSIYGSYSNGDVGTISFRCYSGVTIEKGTNIGNVGGAIIGAYAGKTEYGYVHVFDGSGIGIVSGNNGVSVAGIYGINEGVSNGFVTLSGGTYSGLVTAAYSSGGSVDNNSLVINDGVYNGVVAAGYAVGNSTHYAQMNDLTINGGTFATNVYGAYIGEGTNVMYLTANVVTIRGGTFAGNIYGVYTVVGNIGPETQYYNACGEYNSVIINGDITAGKIYGGYTKGMDSKSSSHGNQIFIIGGTVTATDLIAGKTTYDDTEAYKNEIKIIGDASVSELNSLIAAEDKDHAWLNTVEIATSGTVGHIGELYGGKSDFTISTSNAFNSLVLGNKNITADKAGGFENLTFIIPKGMTSEDVMLKITGTGETFTFQHDGQKNVVVNPVTGGLNAGDTVCLLATQAEITSLATVMPDSVTYTFANGDNTYNGSVAVGGDGNKDLIFTMGTLKELFSVIPTEKVKGNIVTVTSATVANFDGTDQAYSGTGTSWKNAYGGYNESVGDVTGNQITINAGGAAVENGVFGGYSKYGASNNNKVTVDNSTTLKGAFTCKGLVGGYGINGANGNSVEVRTGSVMGEFEAVEVPFLTKSSYPTLFAAVGGVVAYAGDANNNKIILKGGTYYENVCGGYTFSGSANYNSVYAEDAIFYSEVYGGYTEGTEPGQTLNHNYIELKNCIIDYYCVGNIGYSSNAASVYADVESSDNTIILDGCTADYAEVYGGYVGGGGSRNVITIKNCSGEGLYVAGVCNYANGCAGTEPPVLRDNVVTITDSLVQHVAGVYTFGSHAVGNKVFLKGNTTITDNGWLSVSGAYICSDNDIVILHGENNEVHIDGAKIKIDIYGVRHDGTGVITGNIVDFADGTIDTTGAEIRVYGGYGHKKSLVSGNTVTVAGGTIGTGTNAVNIYGGWSENGIAEKNSVTISGGSFAAGSIYGGYGADVKENVVVVGKDVLGTIGSAYGGYSNALSEGGNNVSDNKVTIEGGNFVNGSICGGYAANAQYAGNVNNNEVVIKKATLEGMTISGGYTMNTSKRVNNNTVTLGNNIIWSGTDNEVQMTGGAAGENNTLTVMKNLSSSAAGKGTHTLGSLNGVDRYVFDMVGVNNNDQLLSVINSTTMNDETVIIANYIGSNLVQGDEVELINSATGSFETITNDIYTVELTGSNVLLLTVRASAENVMKAPAEGIAAAAAAINTGSDLVLGAGVSNLITSTAGTNNTTETFAASSYGKSKLKTGNHVDTRGYDVVVGVGRKVFSKNGNKTTGGLFFEYGNSDFDTYTGNVTGSGKSIYKGAGYLMRWDNKSGNYYEGMIHAGKVTTNWNSSNIGGYETDPTYYGAAATYGHKFMIGENKQLSVYGSYIYTHTGSADAKIGNYNYDFEATKSHRTKIGVRYALSDLMDNKKFRPYVGLAWEHEFDGETKATVKGYGKTDAPSMKGDTGILEIGCKQEVGKWTLGVGAEAFIGKRKGWNGTLQATYNF